ncbi:Anthocyanidin 3-O-glucosyltransferase [Sesamum angolense]|uniref:Anthocyanidin 3-O-glucosyltransferase n=1 Tax=Sesamum angolense TaxID=2727404 RepID=A0AAE1X469_9LAMI|nr:Anthocyanidin 3-O-glucosyltransferase [Sesamum angolense]
MTGGLHFSPMSLSTLQLISSHCFRHVACYKLLSSIESVNKCDTGKGCKVSRVGSRVREPARIKARLELEKPSLLELEFLVSSSSSPIGTVSNNTLFNERVSDSYDNIQPYSVRDGTPEGFCGSHFEAVDLFLDAALGNFEKAIGEAEEETGMKICCLISDAFLWFGGDLAAKRGNPWVPFWTAASCSLSVHVYADEILKAMGSTGLMGLSQFLSMFYGPIHSLVVILQGDY